MTTASAPRRAVQREAPAPGVARSVAAPALRRQPSDAEYEADERRALSGEPPFAEPVFDAFQGLEELRSRAIVGYDALIAATSKPVTYVWDGVITAEDHVEVSGQTASGKTTTAILIAAGRANPTGKPVRVLGREVAPAPPGTFVVVIEEENSKRSMRRKFEEACEVLNLPVIQTIDRCVFLVRNGTKVGDAVWLDVMMLGRRGSVALLVIDSRARVLLHGESSKEEDQAAMSNALHAMVEACCAPTIVISHLRKGGGDNLDDVSGSAQRGAGADVVIFVRAKRNKRTFKVESSTVIFAKIREEPIDWPMPVTFILARTGGRPTLTIVSDLEGDVVSVDTGTPGHERIAAYLAGHGLMTKNKIKTALSLNTDAIEAGISELFAQRRIATQRVKVRGKDVAAFELRDDRTTGAQDRFDSRDVLEREDA